MLLRADTVVELRVNMFNTLRKGDADLRFYITTVQDGWRKSAFLTRACFPCTIHLIMQYIEPVSEWSCWRMFLETWPHSELNFRHRASTTGCPRRKVPDFGRVFLMLKYTDITQNTYVQSWRFTEIMAREKCGLLARPHTVIPADSLWPCVWRQITTSQQR